MGTHGEKYVKGLRRHTINLLLRLRRYADAVLLFVVSDPAVPLTNNLVECAIRMPKGHLE